MTIELADGPTITLPIAWFPRLAHGMPAERANWRLIGNGEGIHWADLDEDISVQSLLAGRMSGESQSLCGGGWTIGEDERFAVRSRLRWGDPESAREL